MSSTYTILDELDTLIRQRERDMDDSFKLTLMRTYPIDTKAQRFTTYLVQMFGMEN